MVLLCLIAILSPFITAIAISEGVRFQSLISVREGADLYVTRDNYGSNAPISLRYVEEFSEIQGVLRVLPRVVGRTYFVNKLVIIVGLSLQNLPPSVRCVEGRIFQGREEVIIGTGIARYFNLKIGERFALDVNVEKLFKVVGIFSAGSTIWSSDLIYMSFEDAAELFKLKGMATDILIYTLPGYSDIIGEKIEGMERGKSHPPHRVQTKGLVKRYFQRGFNLKGGIFTALYILAFALAIPVLLVISGFGLTERKREIGVLKATGWQTQDIMEMVGFENLILSIGSASLSILSAMLWLKVFNGIFLAPFFIAGIGMIPDFPVPSRFLPLPCALSFLLALTLTMVGSIYSTWRTSTIPPAEAMR